MSSKALTVAEKGKLALRHVDRRAIKNAVRIVERGMVDATKVEDNGLTAAGVNPWEKEPDAEQRQRVAKDCRQSRRNAPVYLEIALKRIEGAEKLDSLVDAAAPVALNIGTVNIVQAPQYETIDVTPHKVTE